MKKISTVFLVASFLLFGCTSTESPAPTVQVPAPNEQVAKPPIADLPTNEVTSQYFTMAGLAFLLPENWIAQQPTSNNDGWQFAKIQVPDPNYHVTMRMQIKKQDGNDLVGRDELPLKKTVSGAAIYNAGCDGAIACYTMLYKGTTYSVNFGDVASDQPVPPNADQEMGGWHPDTIITSDDTLNFLATVK